jgi:hypothetical protein
VSENADTVGRAAQVGEGSRLTLARLALDVVSMMPGIAGTDAGPGGLCVIADPPFGVLRGVSVIAQPDGRYEVDLCLVARMVPLLSLGEDIRRRLRARAAREGLADQLGTINVEFAQALSAGETMVEVLRPEKAGAEAPQVGAGSPNLAPVATGSQIPSVGPAVLPDEPQPGPAVTPVPPSPAAAPATPAPPPTAPPATPAPPIAPPGSPPGPEEPAGLIGSQTPAPEPVGSPVPPAGCTRPARSSDCESPS